MSNERDDLGMVGLGMMGRNLVLNMAAHDYPVAGYDSDQHQVHALRHEAKLREVVRTAISLGLPAPAFFASLAYLDSYRSAWLPANLIQAQRDYFGARTHVRIDERDVFDTNWEEA